MAHRCHLPITAITIKTNILAHRNLLHMFPHLKGIITITTTWKTEWVTHSTMAWIVPIVAISHIFNSHQNQPWANRPNYRHHQYHYRRRYNQHRDRSEYPYPATCHEEQKKHSYSPPTVYEYNHSPAVAHTMSASMDAEPPTQAAPPHMKPIPAPRTSLIRKRRLAALNITDEDAKPQPDQMCIGKTSHVPANTVSRPANLEELRNRRLQALNLTTIRPNVISAARPKSAIADKTCIKTKVKLATANKLPSRAEPTTTNEPFLEQRASPPELDPEV